MKLQTNNVIIKNSNYEGTIDELLKLASPYLSEVCDDIPVIDILIGPGSKAGWYKASVAIYLDDATLKASSEHLSGSAALQRALSYLAEKISYHEQSKRHYQSRSKKLPKNRQHSGVTLALHY